MATAPAATEARTVQPGSLPTDTLVLEPENLSTESSAAGLSARQRAPGSVALGAGYTEPGYRVQLASSTVRKDPESLVGRVERELESKSYLEEHEGSWCLRLGNFTDREKAEALRARAVSFGFKYAWVVQTEVVAGLK